MWPMTADTLTQSYGLIWSRCQLPHRALQIRFILDETAFRAEQVYLSRPGTPPDTTDGHGDDGKPSWNNNIKIDKRRKCCGISAGYLVQIATVLCFSAKREMFRAIQWVTTMVNVLEVLPAYIGLIMVVMAWDSIAQSGSGTDVEVMEGVMDALTYQLVPNLKFTSGTI